MQVHDQLVGMDPQQLREFAAGLIEQVARQDEELRCKQLKIDQLTHEMAVLRRWKFAARSEQLHGAQRVLFDETVLADLEAIALEIAALKPKVAPPPKEPPKRAPLPSHLPRVEVRHEPEQTRCRCGCQLQRIGEDVSERLDYTPGVFTVERHIRGKWACAHCQTLIQAPVPAQVIDKGIPTAGLLAQVLVAKFLDHQPLYRQEGIFARAGLAIARSTLAQWVGACGVQLQPLVDALRQALLGRGVLHADETPVAMLAPGTGKTHRAYVWSYGTTQFDSLQAVVYDFVESRAGKHAQAFLGEWSGALVCDDFSGYKGLFRDGVTEAGCMAHARRKFHELWANHQSPLGKEALGFFRLLYDVEELGRDLDAEQRRRLRQLQAKPIADTLREWLALQRQRATAGTALAKALDYSLGRWEALTWYLADGNVPIGRVEKWRGGGRLGLSVDRAFRLRCPSNSAVTPFPLPAHRTGRAAFPHPALFQRIRPSRSASQRGAATNGSVPTARREADRDIGGIPFRVCHVVASTRFVDGARHNRRSGDRFALLGLG